MDLDELFGFHQDFYGRNELPDLFTIGFQEVAIKASKIVLEDPWVTKFKDVLVFIKSTMAYLGKLQIKAVLIDITGVLYESGTKEAISGSIQAISKLRK